MFKESKEGWGGLVNMLQRKKYVVFTCMELLVPDTLPQRTLAPSPVPSIDR